MDTVGGIDYVCPMVFPDDDYWLRDMEKAGLSYERNSTRWRSWSNEDLLIDLVRKNMPWLNDIIIILARESQRKPWMKDVRVVYHREFVPKTLLPLFNVNTIEMFLHKIPNLSEKFVYGNDDMFPLSPLKETDFFRNGLPCQSLEEKPLPQKQSIFHIFVRNGLNMIAQDYGKHYEKTYLSVGHSLSAFTKTSIEETWQKYGEKIKNSFTPKRSEMNFNQYIFTYYQHFTGKYVEHAPKRTYTSVRMPPEDIVKVIQNPNPGVVCINDNKSAHDYENYAKPVRNALKEKI